MGGEGKVIQERRMDGQKQRKKHKQEKKKEDIKPEKNRQRGKMSWMGSQMEKGDTREEEK